MKFTLPHWAQLGLNLAIVVLAWLMKEQAAGAIVLPVALVSVLSTVNTLLGLFSDSIRSSGGGGAGGASSGSSSAKPPAGTMVPPALKRVTWPRTAIAVVALLLAPLAVGNASGCALFQNPAFDQTLIQSGAKITCLAAKIELGILEPALLAQACADVGVTVAEARTFVEAQKQAHSMAAAERAARDAGPDR